MSSQSLAPKGDKNLPLDARADAAALANAPAHPTLVIYHPARSPYHLPLITIHVQTKR